MSSDKRRPRIFIGSSRETLPIARAVEINVHYDCEPMLWPNIFELSKNTSDAFFENLKNFDYAIFVLGPDDFVTYRDQELPAPRDNIIYEIGLFTGSLGPKRTFIIGPGLDKLKKPTDWDGLTLGSFEPLPDNYDQTEIRSRVSPICSQILLQMTQLEESGEERMSWDELCDAILSLKNQLAGADDSGFMPHLLVGISRGGAAVADILSRYLLGIPVVTLWADRTAGDHVFDGESPTGVLNRQVLDRIRETSEFRHILLVENVVRSGRTLTTARKFLADLSEEKKIKTATIAVHREFLRVDAERDPPVLDYHIYASDSKYLRTPFHYPMT